jgi:predicted transcriptional regulator
MMPHIDVSCIKLMNTTTELHSVTSRIETDLLDQLQAKADENGRSRDKEIRQAIRAWVGADQVSLASREAA